MSKKSQKQAPEGSARPGGRANHHGGSRVIETNDEPPMALPLDCKTPTPLHQLIARMVQQHVQAETEEEHETFEEANDFDVPEEGDPLLDMSPYTLHELREEAEPGEDSAPPQESREDLQKRLEALEAKLAAAAQPPEAENASEGARNTPDDQPITAHG